jgi:hypothetical protein
MITGPGSLSTTTDDPSVGLKTRGTSMPIFADRTISAGSPNAPTEIRCPTHGRVGVRRAFRVGAAPHDARPATLIE